MTQIDEKKLGDVVVDIWGDYALFAPPESSTEHVTYSVPTPSAMRNFLSAIYAKPKEFYYQITAIEVIKPGTTIAIMKNEVKAKISRQALLSEKKDPSIILTDKKYDKGRGYRTQRNYIYLKDVYYRVYADIVIKQGCEDRVNKSSVVHQFEKRRDKGKCFYQPFLGTRECMAFFSDVDQALKPIRLSQNYGYMLYDVFDPRTNIPLDTSSKENKGITNVMFYQAQMINGQIKVPPVESEEVKKIA